MPLRGQKLGLLLSVRPEHANFRHGLRLAQAALEKGLQVYLYCIDDAVEGLANPELQGLKERGLVLYACAYGARKRQIPVSDLAAFAGLGVVSDLIAATDRFVSFN
jgi:sulfur relay (sulfurtransferase) complex TusBCD TusD component (DsrE family)